MTVFLFEDYISNLTTDGDDERTRFWVQITAFINIMLSVYSLVMVFVQGKAAGQTYFRSPWAYFDMFYVLFNSIINFIIVFKGFESSLDDAIINLRTMESIMSIVIMVKLIYFTQLMDEIAPLVNIILQIFIDILWFLAIFVIIGFSLALSLYLIGQNQMIALRKEAEEGVEVTTDDGPQYVTLVGAFKHVYLLALGEFGLDDYELGGN
mmetsp:Transcript_8198/g.12568  ORF Transcript_8198/g.12568 Transcript_8198/m.12568 type:complete len:209 (+) Transcript_8198:5585-6211(+)